MTLPIDLCRYKIDDVPENGTVPHSHTVTSEIIQVFDNAGSILINGVLYRMQKNGLYFIHGLATHLVSPDDLTHYNHSIIILHTTEIEKLCANLDLKAEYEKIFTEKGGTFCALPPEKVLEVDKLFLDIHNTLESDGPMKYANLSYSFVELLKIGLKYNTEENNPNTKISDIVSFISDNALTRISIDDICKKTHISKYHLCRTFKEHIGVTIGEFIKSRRLSIAKQLLAETELSVTQIAHHCCFTDASFFSKTFYKEIGMTPTVFRSKYR